MLNSCYIDHLTHKSYDVLDTNDLTVMTQLLTVMKIKIKDMSTTHQQMYILIINCFIIFSPLSLRTQLSSGSLGNTMLVLMLNPQVTQSKTDSWFVAALKSVLHASFFFFLLHMVV